MNKIGNRIQAVRETMNKQQIDACIITNSDPHMSEYVPEQWKEREWISGFTGSNGVIVLTKQRMALFTDSRYTIQAENELHGTDCVLITTNKIIEDICIWLNNEFSSSNKTIAIRPNVYSTTSIVEIHNKLNHQFSFLFTDIISSVWSNRPKTIAGKTFILEEKFTGKSSSEKLTEIKKIIQKEKIDAYILTALDEIAWLFNIRGNDIPFNPLCYAYAIIEEDKSSIFINIEKTEKKLIEYFNKNQINIHPYNKISEYVKQFSSKKILIDESKINYQLFKTIPNNCAIISRPSYVSKLKSIKNITEIKGIKNVCIKDGVSLVKLSMWIEENINKTISEISIVEKIKEFHQEQELYVGESFDTIAAYQEHGAIVHYKPTLKSNIQIKPEGFLLLDSGAQYMDGTTDITRTIALGELTEQQKTDYTLVLKGHIALASCKFPSGTYGYQLDVLARQFLWENNLNYGHGTGHGIGHFLCVHEGPVSIRPDNNPTTLENGMLLSNEPGVYRENEYGIRLENMILVVADKKKFLTFETLSLFPFDQKAILFSILTAKEIDWINEYHTFVKKKLSPFLNTEEKKWLEKHTQIINN